jgi:hypothetical protein
MPLALAVALITASPNMLLALAKLFDEIKASGHPPEASLTPAHIAAISAIVTPAPVDDSADDGVNGG